MNKNIIIIDSDNRQSYLIVRQLRDTHPDFVCETFSTVEDFRKKYYLKAKEDVSDGPSISTEDSGSAWVPMKFISLFIVSVDAINASIVADFAQTMIQEASAHKFWESPEAPPQIMLLDYEQSERPLQSFQTKAINDLVYKPIDWQLFLQKLEIILGISKGKSTHIYAQDAEFRIKIAKDSTVEQIADFGFVMRSGGTLPPGSFGYFFFPSEVDKGREGVVARCLFCRPHPTVAGMFQNYFSFFGMSEGMKTSVRDLMMQGRKSGQKMDLTFDKMMQDYQDRLPPEPKNFVIVEMNPKHRETISQLLQENFNNAVVHECASYQDFLRDFLDVGKKSKPALDLVTPLSSDDSRKLTISASIADLTLTKIEPMPLKEGQICGYDANLFLADKKFWLTLLSNDDKQRINEVMAYARAGELSEIEIDLVTESGKRKTVHVKAGFGGKSPRLATSIDFELTDVTNDKLQESLSGHDLKVPRVDGIFLAGEFVGKESTAWLDALRKKLVLKGMAGAKVRVPFFIFFNEDIEKTPEDYKDYGFDEFIYRPIDRSLLLKRMRLHFPFLKIKTNVSIPLEFYNRQMLVHVARDVTLEQVAEYGIKIRYPRQMGEGDFYTLFHPIFLDDDGHALTIRSYFDREHPIHKEQFEIYFSFFGVKDGFLKRIRRWIREQYAVKAGKAEG